jgi:transcription elongation factor Elf1
MDILNKNTQKKQLRARFCPYCGSSKLKTKMAYAKLKDHKFCTVCNIYFEVQQDWFNDLEGNNEESSLKFLDLP